MQQADQAGGKHLHDGEDDSEVIHVKKDEKQDIAFHNYFLLLPRLLVLVHAHILGLHDICEPKKRQTSIERYIEVKSNGLTGGSERNVNNLLGQK